jgi:imidazolonepropionase-like amidohydrolase
MARVVRLDGRPPRAPAAVSVLVDADGGALAGNSRAATWMLLAQALDEARGQTPPPAGEARLLTPAGRRVLRSFLAEQKPMLIEANRASDIRAVIEFAEREKVKVIIRGGAEAWRVAAPLKRADIPVVLDPLADLPESFDQLGATLDNAARLYAAGVTFAFSLATDEPHNIRTLRQAAGIAVAHGLPWDAAFSAITSSPAKVFRATGDVGSIEIGRPANIVTWSGDPLEVTSLVEDLWVNGVRTPVRSRQTELRDRYLPKVRAGTAR